MQLDRTETADSLIAPRSCFCAVSIPDCSTPVTQSPEFISGVWALMEPVLPGEQGEGHPV